MELDRKDLLGSKVVTRILLARTCIGVYTEASRHDFKRTTEACFIRLELVLGVDENRICEGFCTVDVGKACVVEVLLPRCNAFSVRAAMGRLRHGVRKFCPFSIGAQSTRQSRLAKDKCAIFYTDSLERWS